MNNTFLYNSVSLNNTGTRQGLNLVVESFGEMLRKLRESKSWTGERLAEESRVTQGLISKYETGERTPKRATVLKLAEALNTPAEPLLRAVGLLPKTADGAPIPDTKFVVRPGVTVDVYFGGQRKELTITESELRRLWLEAELQEERAKD